jgi:glucosamine--fructose-6-phosphate aminotransferase (isomerizing)
MNNKEERYSRFAIVNEMIETAQVIKNLDTHIISGFSKTLKGPSFFFSGEGSSRIFPSKKTMYDALACGYSGAFYTEGATQATEYQLGSMDLLVASNSGKTKEAVRLIRHARERGSGFILSVVATGGTPIATEADSCYVLSCGKEEAVAATKSVVEQALFYDILFRQKNGKPLPDLRKLSELFEQALTQTIPKDIIEPLKAAKMLYWAGKNNGVAEELTLKTNEITRKKSDFLEGTYAAHGIEEVMNQDDAVILVDPWMEEEEKLTQVLVKGVRLPVIAVSGRKTAFPTVAIPTYGEFTPYIELAAGWNILVEIGLGLSVDLDKPRRARKVGNEYPAEGEKHA